MINQSNREEIIKLLDKSSDNVKLEDLFLFDLSPYYEEKKNDSFFSKQLEYIQEKNLLSHNPQISFTSEQIRIYQEIVANIRCIVSAPTSFGKTMLVKEYIYNFQPDKVVFIVPTNSLADELLDDFKNLFQNLGYTIFDSVKSEDKIDGKSIFIGTQEKYYNLIQFYDHIDLFVIDEAYKLTDQIKGSREVILNRSFIDTLEITSRIILLMPLVNLIIGLEHLNFEILKTDYAPVAKNFNPIKNIENEIIETVKKNNTTNLIYFNCPKELEKFYLKYLKRTIIPFEINNKWIKRVEEDFHPEWLPIQALNSGIGIHYGPMPKFIQKKVVELFKSDSIRNILATNSIIEGVNTPTKNIYIVTSKDILGEKDRIRYKNLIGRAGRLGEHKVGNIFYSKKHQEQFEKANVSYNEIDIEFIIENKAEIIDINREDENIEGLNSETKESNESNKALKNVMESTNFSNVSHLEMSERLNAHGFTLKQFEMLIDYVKMKKDEICLLGIIGKFNRNIDIDTYIVALKSQFNTFNEMVEELHQKKPEEIKSKIISSLIDMIYNTLPFKIIPLIDFTIDINDLYLKYNGKSLVNERVIEEARKKKAQFYSKFIGFEDPNCESLAIVNKLFEYGIPYQRVMPYIQELTEKLPNKFSVHDIRKIIFEVKSMEDLRIYFE